MSTSLSLLDMQLYKLMTQFEELENTSSAVEVMVEVAHTKRHCFEEFMNTERDAWVIQEQHNVLIGIHAKFLGQFVPKDVLNFEGL